MSAPHINDDSLGEVARRYHDLLNSIRYERGAIRPAARVQVLLDSIRAALDQQSQLLNVTPPSLIANSFWHEQSLNETRSTHILRVRQRDTDQLYVLKTIADGDRLNPETQNRLLREAQIHAQMSHSAIIRFHTLLRLDDGRPGLLMENASESLAGHLTRLLPEPAAIRDLAQQLFEGLAVIHNTGFVHADICPANLLIGGHIDHQLKIADFGVSIPIGRTHQAIGYRRAYNSEYSAPEQQDGAVLDQRTDLYACGKVLEFALQGMDLGNRLTCGLDELAQILTAHDPAQRPESCDEVLAMLQAF